MNSLKHLLRHIIPVAAGVSVSSPLLMALGAISTTVGAGGASVVSRALGSKDVERASRTVASAFMIFWTSAILVTIFGLLFLDKIIYGLGATESIAPYARDYGRVILLGAITSTGYSAIVRADGNVKFSTAMWLIPVGVNIVLDPLFIYGFKWGVTMMHISIWQCVSNVITGTMILISTRIFHQNSLLIFLNG